MSLIGLCIYCLQNQKKPYSHLSNKRGAHAYRFWKIPPSTKKNPPQVFDIIAEPNDNFSHGQFEL